MVIVDGQKVTAADLNALAAGADLGMFTHRYNVFINGDSEYDAYDSSDGTLVGAQSTLAALINPLVADGVTFFFIKPASGQYELATTIDLQSTDHVTFKSDSWGTEIRATSNIDEMFDLTSSRFNRFEKLQLNGYDYATRCINASHAAAWVPMHRINDMWIWGAKESNIDLSGCEDCVISRTYLDGRIVEGGDSITEYGLSMMDNHCGGQVNLYGVYAGYHTVADYYFKEVDEIYVIGGLSASKSGNEGAAGLEAGIKFEGGGSVQGHLTLTNFWMENNDKPNILITNETSAIRIYGGRYYTNDVPNIYGTNDPSTHSLSLFDTKLQADGTATYNVDAYINDLSSSQVQMVGAAALNTTKIDDYYVNIREGDFSMSKKLYQNEELVMANDTYLCWKDSGGTKREVMVMRATDDAVKITNAEGGLYVGADMTDGILIGYNSSGVVSIGTGTTKPSSLQLESATVVEVRATAKFNQSSAGTLSGTPICIEVQDVNGDTYYLNAYPTKT